MIENEQQYQITKDQIAKLEAALFRLLNTPPPPTIHPRIHQAQIEAVQSQLHDLRQELIGYKVHQAPPITEPILPKSLRWVIDSANSVIYFQARYMMVSIVRGEFHTFRGTVNFNEENPVLSTVDVEIEPASLETRDVQRDRHLKSADFFDVENHPIATFKGTHVEVIGDREGNLYGDLTIKNISHPVVLDVKYNGQSVSPWGTISAGFTATTKINRREWGMNWNVPLETGGVLVGEEVKLTIEAEIVKQSEIQSEAEETTSF